MKDSNIEAKAKRPKANKNNEGIETEMQQEWYENIQEKRHPEATNAIFNHFAQYHCQLTWSLAKEAQQEANR
jgi:hypothetical protein